MPAPLRWERSAGPLHICQAESDAGSSRVRDTLRGTLSYSAKPPAMGLLCQDGVRLLRLI